MVVRTRKEIIPGKVLRIPQELYTELTEVYGQDLLETLNRRYFIQTDRCTACGEQNQVRSKRPMFRFQLVASSTGEVLYRIRCRNCEYIILLQARKRVEEEQKRQRQIVLKDILPVLQPLLAAKTFKDGQTLFQRSIVITEQLKYAVLDFVQTNNLKCETCGQLDIKVVSTAVEISELLNLDKLPDELIIKCRYCEWERHHKQESENFHELAILWQEKERERIRKMRRVSRKLRKYLDIVELK